MSALDGVMPLPRMVEVDRVDLTLPIGRAWEIVRHGNLTASPLVRLLFAVRLLASDDATGDGSLRIDDFRSSPEQPGFGVLVDDPPREVVVGAIGKVWKLDIPFVHVASAEAFEAFREAGFVKVAWAIRLTPLGAECTRVAVEVRVDATDERSWRRFKRYFKLIGPGSHFIRRSLLNGLAAEFGTPEAKESSRPLPGDELLPDARARATQCVTIRAKPEAIWPWLVQMGCGRAGFYSLDALDNGGQRSAREIHPDLQRLAVGDGIPATPDGAATFEVLALAPNRHLVLGGLHDVEAGRQLPFGAERPAHFWHATWSFYLEPIDEERTKLHVRGRAAYAESERLRAFWTRAVHGLMQKTQLRHLVARAEGRLAPDDWRDVASGMGGAAIIVAALFTPFLRDERVHWGLDEESAARAYPGDDVIPIPLWSWTHGVEIDAPPEAVWPWVAQIGAERGGFYSYQWLENLVGCRVHNAESMHPEWAVAEGGSLSLHPRAPAMRVVRMDAGRWFLAHAGGGVREASEATAGRWAEATWLFFVEPLEGGRSRFISRYRCACSEDAITRVSFGATLMEPVGFAMDRRMLLGVRARVERHTDRSDARHT